MNGFLANLFAGDVFPVSDAAELIAVLRQERGLHPMLPYNGPNGGAYALAEWLLAAPDNFAAIERMSCGLDYVERILCGELIPSDLIRAGIASVTGGAVLPEMFERKAAIRFPNPEASPALGSVRPGNALPGPDAILPVDRIGELGRISAGPLFQVIAPTRDDRCFFIAGLGLGLRLDRATTHALHNAIGAAIQEDRP